MTHRVVHDMEALHGMTLDCCGPICPSRDASEAGSAIAHRGKHSVPKRSHAVDGIGCNCLNRNGWALNSAVECHLHTVEVIGSNPIAPTILFRSGPET